MNLPIFWTVSGFALVAYLLSYLPFLILLIKARKLDASCVVLNKDSTLYKLVNSFRLQNPGFWRGAWGYKLWWSAAIDFVALALVALYVLYAANLLQTKNKKIILYAVAGAILLHLVIVVTNIVSYTRLFKSSDGLFHQLALLDQTVKEVSTDDARVLEHFRRGFAEATAEAQLSAQDLRGLIVGALNLTKGGSNLARVFTTSCIVWYLHQLPPQNRYDAIREYLATFSIQKYLTPQSRTIVTLDKTSYISESVYGAKFLKTKEWPQFFNNVEVALQRLNTRLPQIYKYEEVLRRYKKHITFQLVLRTILLAFLLAAPAVVFM